MKSVQSILGSHKTVKCLYEYKSAPCLRVALFLLSTIRIFALECKLINGEIKYSRPIN